MKPIVFTLAALSLVGIFDHELWTPDEPRDAEISREISGAVPTLNFEPFLEKPPLYFWSVGLSYKIFGVHAWSSRLPSILFGWGALAFTFLLGRRMFDARVGANAALLLGTMILFVDVTHKCIVDNALLFFTTGTFYWLYDAYTSDRKLRRYLAAYVFALGAFLSKGFIGVGLAGASFAAFLIWERNYREFLRAQPWFAILIVGGGAAVWLMQLAPEQQREFLVQNQFGRFFGGGEFTGGHRWPFYMYGPWLLYAFAPWTLLLPFAFRFDRYLVTWIGVGIVVLCLALTKRDLYLLPLCPAAALMIASGKPKPILVHITHGVLAAAGLAAVGFAIYARNWIGLAPAIAVLGAAWAWGFRRDWPQRLGMAAAGFLAAGIFAAVPFIDEHKNLRPFFVQLPPMDPIPAFKPDETTLAMIPFYTGRTVLPVEEPGDTSHLVVVVKRNREHEKEALRRLQEAFPYTWVEFEAKPNRTLYLLSKTPK